MRYVISLNFKYLPLKMNWEKYIFQWGKWTIELIGNLAHTKEYLVLGKALLAGRYLYLKVYITLTKNLMRFLMTQLSYTFCIYFYHNR